MFDTNSSCCSQGDDDSENYSGKIQFRANRQALHICDLNIIDEHDWSYEVGPTATKNMHDINTIGADEPFDTPYNRRALAASLEYQ